MGIKFNIQSPKKTLNKAFLKQRPLRSDIDLFKNNLIRLLGKVDEIEREENQKNHIRDFLLDTYYKNTNEINTKDNIDLVIHLGKTNKEKVGVIFEAKKPSNKTEMVTADKSNVKSFHELILYYFDERIESNNNELKQLVITNVYEWFIFDANYFDKFIYRNTKIKKLYDIYTNDRKDTQFFYEEVSKIILQIDIEIPCTYFDIREYKKFLLNSDKTDDKNLISLQKILSPYHLLKIQFADDSNKLDEKFYKELLHIIGLEEAKVGSKFIIRRKEVGNRNPASLIENAIEELKTVGLHKITDLKIFGETNEEQLFNISLELCIIWINRILFLKLLEGQLINYHQGDKYFRFLNGEMINNFDELFNLFHKVLAVPQKERIETIKQIYSRIPYLNSSLFEISELEEQTIKINSIGNSNQLELINSTILKEQKKKSNKLPTLDYLFKFLDYYDFSTEGTEDIQEDVSRTLINASVLGKVFEKINGYKDGSIFTPGFITMYMCKQSIRLAVLQKFKEKYGWKLETFDDLKNYLADRKTSKDILEFNALINSLRLCDPAVGSGHFLVSSLNEIIAIKYELGLLADDKGIRITDYEITIENDELIITDRHGDIFQYHLQNGKPVSKEMQRLQITLFHEKQTIIENCLFGVDINPNSVKICRLRLWIELLKNAYYKEPDYSELETLPNIDINIKCGNSLLSRFPLDSDLSKALKSTNYSVEQYREYVSKYKNERNRDIKRDLQKIIYAIKNDLKTNLFQLDPKRLTLIRISGELRKIMIETNLFGESIKQIKEKKENQRKLEIKIKKLTNEIDEIETNAIYKNSFEWRFEFPEVLNDNGDFEGFDVLIGNPPYIGIEDITWNNRRFYETIYKTATGRFDLYSLFIEKAQQIKVSKGAFTFIVPGKFLNNKQFTVARKIICQDSDVTIVKIDEKVFDKAQVNSVIIASNIPENIKDAKYKAFMLSDDKLKLVSETSMYKILDERETIFRIEINNEFDNLISKIEKDTLRIKEIANVSDGIVAGGIKDLLFLNKKQDNDSKKLYFGKHLNKYHLSDTTIWVNYKPAKMMKEETNRKGDKRAGLWMRDEKIFNREKILYRKVGTSLMAAYSGNNEYFEQTLHCVFISNKEFKTKYVLGLFNSELFNFYYTKTNSQGGDIFPQVRISSVENLPIKIATSNQQEKIEKLVNKIISQKQQGKDSTENEKKIDELVYKLYDITPEEQKIIEND